MGWGCVICFHCQIKFERSFSKQPYEGRNEIIALKIEDFQGNYLISTRVGLFGKAPSKFNLAMKTYYTTPFQDDRCCLHVHLKDVGNGQSLKLSKSCLKAAEQESRSVPMSR